MSLNNLKKITIGVVLTAGASSCLGFDAELGVALEKNDRFDDLHFQGKAEYYFTPLFHSSKTPWSETKFTERIGSLRGNYEYRNNKVETSLPGLEGTRDLGTSTNTVGIVIDYRTGGSPHVIRAGLDYQELKADAYSAHFGFDPETNAFFYEYEFFQNSAEQYLFTAGYHYYLQDQWTLGADFVGSDGDIQESQSLVLSSKKIWTLSNQKWFGLNAGALVTRVEQPYASDITNWQAMLEGRYYFSPKTSLSVGAQIPENSFARTITYALGVETYLSEAARLSFEVKESETKFSTNVIQPDGNPLSDISNTVFRVSFSYKL